jgi:hypothetical protein
MTPRRSLKGGVLNAANENMEYGETREGGSGTKKAPLDRANEQGGRFRDWINITMGG